MIDSETDHQRSKLVSRGSTQESKVRDYVPKSASITEPRILPSQNESRTQIKIKSQPKTKTKKAAVISHKAMGLARSSVVRMHEKSSDRFANT
jgi:hypothetical protein